MTPDSSEPTAGKERPWTMPVLSDRDFQQFSALIYKVCGIKMPPSKKTMLTSRLNKRLRKLEIDNFTDYLRYLGNPIHQQKEMVELIDVVSTNKTDFFREPHHFDYLTAEALPEFAAAWPPLPRRHLRLWSAGCSSGEEPYTLAMVLAEFAARHPGLDYSILATDICTKVLATASQGVYPEERIVGIPTSYLPKYFLRGTRDGQKLHRVGPKLRNKVTFQRLNFMDRDFQLGGAMDIIFCRNVIIYFDLQTQIALFKKFHRYLAPGGFLFIGHSEMLVGIEDRMTRVASSVYRRID